ncbi:MAG TPA: thiamine phosphate synthase [Novosphingobium sp.]
MARRYSVPMPPRQTSRLPHLWLITDARTDPALDASLRRLPTGAGVVFRHYHLAPERRAARFRRVLQLGRARGLVVVWAGSARAARQMRADGCYGPPRLVGPGPAGLRLVTAHSLTELAAAARARADLVLLSPAFPTRSHPAVAALGPLRWLLLAPRSPAPALALGGMNARRARRLPGFGWAAIDGLAHKNARIPKDS